MLPAMARAGRGAEVQGAVGSAPALVTRAHSACTVAVQTAPVRQNHIKDNSRG